jgi:hypothetical protein
MDLERLQPEGAAPKRTRGVEFVKNRKQFATMSLPHSAQSRYQAEGNAPVLVPVIHVMQHHAIELLPIA